MINLTRKSGNTSTGIHMLQRSGKRYKFRCCQDSLKRLTSVDVKNEHLNLFTQRKDGVYHSELFDSVEDGKDALIDFIFKVCGVRCKVD